MLRQISSETSKATHCFHNNLTDTTYTVAQNMLYKQTGKQASQPINIQLDIAQTNFHPQSYLHHLTILTGDAILNTQCTIVTNKADAECTVRSTKSLCDRACWQFHVPGSLYGIQLGICYIQTNGSLKHATFQINSSTARTVTFMVDDNQLKIWVNDFLSNKKLKKQLQWPIQDCYPYAKLTVKGSSLIINPFSTQPNTFISKYNPFNTHNISQQIPKLVPSEEASTAANAKILLIKQINADQMFVLAQGGYVKVFGKNYKGDLQVGSQFRVSGNFVSGLFDKEEQLLINKFSELFGCKDIDWSRAYHIDSVFNWLKHIIILVDKNLQKDSLHCQLTSLLLQKLCRIRPHTTNKIPTEIFNCSLDRQRHKNTIYYFPSLLLNGRPANQIKYRLEESLSWRKIQGNFVQVSQHYLCTSRKIQQSQSDVEIVVYFINAGVREVFRGVCGDGVQFTKSKKLKTYGDVQTNLWQQTSQASEIYKILSNCFTNPSISDSTIFELQQKDLTELVTIFKTPKQDAVAALQQTGNIEDALAWLADPNHKVLRKKKIENEAETQKFVNLINIKCSIYQLPRSCLTARLLLQVKNSIYVVGFQPSVFAKRYVQKTDKGFMNLSTFEYGASLSELDGSFILDSFNYDKLSLLDRFSIQTLNEYKKCEILQLFSQNQTANILVKNSDETISKIQLEFNQENVYREQNSIKVTKEAKQLFTNQDAVKQTFRTNYGELFVEGLPSNFKPGTVVSTFTKILTNLQSIQFSQATTVVQAWLKIQKPLALSIQQSEQSAGSHYLPLLVEHGPPGCNMNYPICSILYPKSALPFLANYPYSLTFRHLHDKYIKVSEVIISRIGEKSNVNQIKEGNIYFTDHSGLRSENYPFRFEEKAKELTVKINSNSYWAYMIIQPKYSEGVKLPYEIGFMGAKGVTVQVQEYERAIGAVIEESIQLTNKNGRCNFQLKSLTATSNSTYKALLQTQSSHPSTISSSTPLIQIQQQRQSLSLNEATRKQKEVLKTSEIIQMSSKQLIEYITQKVSKPHSKDGKNSLLTQVFKQIGKNQNIRVSGWDEREIKMFVDVWISYAGQTDKDYERVYDKLRSSQVGAKYIDGLVEDIGKGFIQINPKHLQLLLSKQITKQTTKTGQKILHNILEQLPKLRNPLYQGLQKHQNTPYLLLQQNYYSKYYFNQIQGIAEGNSTETRCDPIYQQDILTGYQFVTLKDNKFRKIIVQFNQLSSIKNVLLRFDRTQTYNRAFVAVYAWVDGRKQACGHSMLQEHQWIQITKNPYREQMATMFANNHSWLNGLGISLDTRVQTCYLQIEVMFNTCGIMQKQLNSTNVIQIIPEVYGQRVDQQPRNQKTPYSHYFEINEQQKIFLSKVAQKLQISPSIGSCSYYKKYLVNKQNTIQYQIYESSTSQIESQIKAQPKQMQSSELKSKKSHQQALVQQIVQIAQLDKKIDDKILSAIVERYQGNFRGLVNAGSQDGHSFSNKVSLDFCYTVIMWILEIQSKKQIIISKELAKELLQKIVKVQIGPVTLSCLKSISKYSELLLEALKYVKIKSEDEKGTINSISSTFIKANNQININEEYTNKALESKDPKLAQSLMNIIIDTQNPSENTIKQCIELVKLTKTHDKVIKYILKFQGGQRNVGEVVSQRKIFTDAKNQTLHTAIIKYIFDEQVPSQTRKTQFLSHLNTKQLQNLILSIRKLNNTQKLHLQSHLEALLHQLFNNKQLNQLSLDIVSLVFQLDLSIDEKWDYLEKCIKYSPTAEDMIHCQYLSSSRQQREQLLQLVEFHRDILSSVVKSQKNSQLLVNFLGEVFHCNRDLFLEIVNSLPEAQGEVFPLHSDIYSLIIKILQQNCNLGGIEGTKLCTQTQSSWLSAVLKLFKLSNDNINSQTLTQSEAQGIIKWYLLNNQYQEQISNPLNRSQAVHNMKLIGQYASQVIRKIGGAKNINKIFKTYTAIKDEIKKDKKRLASAKHLILLRLQNGVFKLIENSLQSKNLAEVLTTAQKQKSLAEQIIYELEYQQSQSKSNTSKPSRKEQDLSEQLQAFTVQDNSLVPLNCKDLQSYKSGSKSFITKITLASRKMFIKSSSNSPLFMTKFAVGFNVQDNSEKNCLLPDYVELYGGMTDQVDGVPTGMKKIADLGIVQDQNYMQFGVRLFAINFDCISRQYRNGSFNILQLRPKYHSQTSTSDYLQSTQKSQKNAVFNISFVSISGFKQQPTSQLSFSNIYMKMLTFLSKPEYKDALKDFIKHVQKKGLMNKLIQLLSAKAKRNPGPDRDQMLEKLLIAFEREGVPVLAFLLGESSVNQGLVDRVVKSNITTQNIDLVVQNTLKSPLAPQTLTKLTQNIKLCSRDKKNKKSKMTLPKIVEICQRYEKQVGKSSDSENSSEQAELLRVLLACITTTSSLFQFDCIQLIKKLVSEDKGTTYYPIVSTFVANDNAALQWFLKSGKVDQISSSLLEQMSIYKTTKSKAIQSQISNLICLLSSLTLHTGIRAHLLSNPENLEIGRLPIKLFKLLSNEQSLIQQYPLPILKEFINFFQQTCTTETSSCSQQFAEKLIQVMSRLPEVPATYHNYFIHHFFFHLINVYNGVLVSFAWKTKDGYINKPTEILTKHPIRKNDSIRQFKSEYYKLVKNNEEFGNNYKKILTFKEKVVAWSEANQWKLFDQQGKHQLKTIIQNPKSLKLVSTEEVLYVPNSPPKDFKCFVHDTQICSEQLKLLTNQTLLRIERPSIFPAKYNSSLPLTIGMNPYIYLLPSEMSIKEMINQINICGYVLNEKTRSALKVKLYSTDQYLDGDSKLADVFNKVSSIKPLIQIQIYAKELFKLTTIQKIANQSVSDSELSKFVAQDTVFKSFEKLKGLEKMIKVVMACVKNWSNQQQSKVWSQYLSQLLSFSCFPIFSSIYMNKKENVQLLFNLLSGLPDKEDNKKWLEEQKKSVKFLYEIIKNVFEVQGNQAIVIRQFAVQNKFYETMLQRLHLVTKQNKRIKKTEQTQQQEQLTAPMELTKKTSEQEYKKQIKKKKGVGYGNDSSTSQKWDIASHETAKKQLSDQILGLIKILEKFLSHPTFKLPNQFLEITYASAILPILQASLRAGSLLEISKNAEIFKEQLRFIRTISKNQVLIPALLEVPKIYEPKQLQSIFSLLKNLEETSRIFLNCLTGSVSQKTSEEMAKDIIETYNQVQQAIENYKIDHVDEQSDKKIFELPLAKKYPILLKDLRFDYIDMKDNNGKMKHHYNSNYQAKHSPPQTKSIRLAQQLADISQALPIEHTNAIFVRCDKNRVDFMQALIMGSNGTPYGHGAYLFDIYFDDSYPNNPPKVNLTTTGSGSIRFNPNLYACGKVCLSLLGTWRGSAMENWDAKVSTLLQVLVSIQSIIMAQEIYFNQPGFQHEQGTVEGQKKNEAYSNIVRYGNIKFAMIENLKNPPKGFETVIRRHFYLKKEQILQQCRKWVKFAQKREASYTGLVSDHNNNWSTTFKKSKNEYKNMLQKAISQLQMELNKLPEPSAKDFIKQGKVKKEKKQKKQVKVEKDENLQDIDVTYDVKDANEESKKLKEMDINDQKVKDRWSRYIGAMGLEAVSKQSKASIFMFGLSGLGIQIAKNIVLSGCKRFTVCDDQQATWNDLSGQFYLTEDQIGKNRVQSCLYKLKDLNNYVRVDSTQVDITKLDQENKLKDYQVVISTIHDESEIKILDNYCRKNGVKFIAVKCAGPYGTVFNDFGDKFQVLDKNGEEAVECFVENITNQEKGVVTLMKGQKHPYEDGDQIKITKVKGMESKTQIGASINESIHKISVINQSSFRIGDTTSYTPYQGNGLVKNMKVATQINFKSYEECLPLLNIDENLAYYDFAKSGNNKTLHNCFRTLSAYRAEQKGSVPKPWNWQDAENFYKIYQKITKQGINEPTEIKDDQKSYVYRFSFTCSGSFAPLAAFYGGLIAQEAFKAITSKYRPINQFFLTDFTEVIEDLPKQFGEWKQFVNTKYNYKSQDDRFEGLRSIVGNQLLEKIRDCKVFVIGSGAIGCELLKNYAMINLATSQKPNKGAIVVTDPDHIQTSNLNRQFLFRQKHLQKPKSSTAAAVVRQMNKYLKGENKIRAKLIKVCQATRDTFSNQFFESMDIVTNALDNVQARQYVDLRCVQNKVALLESGTLSTKGHVQVIIPYKTQTYGSKADPAEEGDIPHCTLKMFPQETLHCVEWARDLFGKTFTMKPKALQKIIQGLSTYTPNQQQTSLLKDCLEMLREKPTNFDDAVYSATKQFYKFYRNDIKQLLYAYPLDAKTKDGKDFWKLPKRPPTPIEQLNPQIKLHGQFITSYAVLLCKIFNVPYPKDFRSEQKRAQVLKQATKIKIDPFVPSDKLAKQMATEVQENKDPKKKEQMEEQIKQKGENQNQQNNFLDLFKQLKQILAEEAENTGSQLKVSAQQFEKDDDANGHIDLIYSMANLRASNYRLDPMDWITTKLKAGRITPALSTTTSCIAALQTIQLIKYLKKVPIDQMKNTFLNLAVPIIQAGEPGQLQKIKIHSQLTTNAWQRWSVDDLDLNVATMIDLMNLIQQKYKVNIRTLNIAGGGPIYRGLVLDLESKKQQKKQLLQRKVIDVLTEEVSAEELKNFIDLTLQMSVGDEFVKHVPTLRVNFKK